MENGPQLEMDVASKLGTIVVQLESGKLERIADGLPCVTSTSAIPVVDEKKIKSVRVNDAP